MNTHLTLRLEDNAEFVKALGKFEDKLPKIQRRVVGKLLSLAKKDVQKNHLSGQELRRRTGVLYRSIMFKTARDGYGYIQVKKDRYTDYNGYYAGALEEGARILPKIPGGYLTFRGSDGEWKRAHEIVLPARPFFTQPVTQFFNGNKGVAEADKVLQDSLNKIFGVQ